MEILRILFLVIFAFASTAIRAELSSGTVPHNHSAGNSGGATLQSVTITSPTINTATVTSTPTNSAACATGYTRYGFNYCKKNTEQEVTLASGCQTITVPTTAKLMHFQIELRVLSAGTVGLRQNNVGFHSNSTCTALKQLAIKYAHEEVSKAAQEIYSDRLTFISPIYSEGVMYFFSNDANNLYRPVGYWE